MRSPVFSVRELIRPGLVCVGLALVACLLTGCVVDQKSEIQKYRDVLDDHRDKPLPLKPGEVLSLRRALALANQDNEQLASQGENYLQALIAKNRALGAFLPSVSFQPNFVVEQAPKGNAAPTAAGAPPETAADEAASQGGYVHSGGTLHRFEAPVVGNMDFSYRNVPLAKAANTQVSEERQRLLDAQSTILLNVAQAYYQVLISERQVGVLQHSLTLQVARVANLQQRYVMRLSLPLEVSQAQAQEAATQVLLRHAQTDARNGRRTLAILVGTTPIDNPLVDETYAPYAPLPVKHFVDHALATRQDLLAAQDAVKVARFQVKAAVAEYYPTVSASVTGFLYREDYANSSKWNGILLANLPIFSAGQIRADVRTAWSRLRQAGLAENYLHREIEANVQTAYDNLDTSGAVLLDLENELKASAEAYHQAVQMEENGLAIPLDVLTAQDTLLNSELQYANEAYSRTVYYLDLVRAIGDLNPVTPLTPYGPAVPGYLILR